MMRLADRVNIIEATMVEDRYGDLTADWTHPITVASNVPAYVGYVTVATVETPGRQAITEELRAIVAPREFLYGIQRIVWRGKSYITNEIPMVRTRNGRDHHLTIQLQLVTG